MIGWVKADLAAGKLSPEKAEQMFSELGASPEQRAPDSRTAAEKELDAACPVARPEEYRITYADVGQDPPVMTPEQKAFDSSARTWLSGAGFPRDVGNSLVSAIAKVTQHTRSMTPEQLESYGYAEFEKLQKVHGDKLEERLQQAGRMVEDLEKQQPGLKYLLRAKGIGDSSLVANLLMGHAPIYHARKR
jgi:hypothetical protein